MTISVYDQTAGTMKHMLNNLGNIVTKAEAYAKAGHIEPSALLRARLFPTMRDFIFQIQVATDMAKSCAAYLTGSEVPKWEDDEETFADVHARIKKALDYLDTFGPEQFEGSERKDIELKLRDGTHRLSGRDYVLRFVIPNFYFHIATAYGLMRHNGLDLSKRDFIGGFQSDG